MLPTRALRDFASTVTARVLVGAGIVLALALNGTLAFAGGERPVLALSAPSAASAMRPQSDAALERGDFWSMWENAAHCQCPGNDLKWLGMSEDAADYVGGFDATLPQSDQKTIETIVDDRCREEVGGFTCLLAVHVDAYKRLGLLKRFAAFGCEHYECSHETEICTTRRR